VNKPWFTYTQKKEGTAVGMNELDQ
jgi:hypothetical protein